MHRHRPENWCEGNFDYAESTWPVGALPVEFRSNISFVELEWPFIFHMLFKLRQTKNFEKIFGSAGCRTYLCFDEKMSISNSSFHSLFCCERSLSSFLLIFSQNVGNLIIFQICLEWTRDFVSFS